MTHGVSTWFEASALGILHCVTKLSLPVIAAGR